MHCIPKLLDDVHLELSQNQGGKERKRKGRREEGRERRGEGREGGEREGRGE